MQKILVLVALTSAVSAAPHALAQWHIAVEPAVRYVTVSEYNQTGNRIVQESGWLPGIGGILGYRNGDLEGFAAARIFRSDIEYDGRLQNGTPYASTTATRLTQAQLGMKFRFIERTSAIAALEYDGWKRNIKGYGAAVGLREHTQSMRLVLGVEQQWQVAGGSFFAFTSVGRVRPERLNIHFSGVFDDASLRTRPATGYALDLRFQPAARPKFLFGALADYMKVPRSGAHVVTRNGLAAGEIAQPEHVRKSVTFYVRYLL